MAIYYVSTQRGDDLNNGLSQAAPWATLGHAVGQVAAGDTVHIGPGTYRERVVLVTAGTAGAEIRWLGDPDCQHLTDDHKDRVRITATDAHDVCTAGGPVWDFASQDYNELKHVWVDGVNAAGDLATYIVSHMAANCLCEDVHAQYGPRGFGGTGTCRRCSALVSRSGFLCTTHDQCVGISCQGAAFSLGTHTNCIGISGDSAAFGSSASAFNCLGLGRYGLSVGSAENCVALGAFVGAHADTHRHNTSIACRMPFETGDTLVDCREVSCYAGGQAGSAESAVVLFDLMRLFYAFEPWFAGNAIKDTGFAGTVAADARGRPRPLGSGVDRGPWEFSDVAPQWAAGTYHTSPPGLRIDRKGMQVFDLPAPAGQTVTVKVRAKHLNTTGDKPQLQIGRILTDGTFSEIASDTCFATADTWDLLQVQATPEVDELLKVRLYARDTGATAYALFSDVDVS